MPRDRRVNGLHRLCLMLLIVAALYRPANVDAAGLPASPEGAGLMYPSVVDNLYDGKFDKVPDDLLFRNYIVTLFKGFNETCTPSPSADSIAAAKYGFPDEVERISKNPFGVLGEMLQGLVQYRDTGDIEALQSLSSPISYSQEALEDAAGLVKTYKCNTWEMRQLRTRISQLIQLRKEVTPEPTDNRRAVVLMHPRYREILGLKIEDFPPLPQPGTAKQQTAEAKPNSINPTPPSPPAERQADATGPRAAAPGRRTSPAESAREEESVPEPQAEEPAPPVERLPRLQFGVAAAGHVDAAKGTAFEIEVSAPALILFDIVSSTEQASYSLTAPSGEAVFQDERSDAGPLQISETGTYRLSVEAIVGTAADFQIRIVRIR